MRNSLLLLIMSLMFGSETRSNAQDNTTPAQPLKLLLNVQPGKETTTNLTMALTFVNVSTNPVSLLDLFEPTPVFLRWDIRDKDGKPMRLPGAGKVDFGPGALKYTSIPPSGAHIVPFNFSQFVKESGQTLKPGTNTISVTYHNQYGKNCFKGILESPRIVVGIKTPE